MKASHLSQNAFFEKKVGEEVRRMRRVGETNEGSILAFGEPTWGEISVDLSDDVNEILYETPDVPSDLLRLTQKFKADKYWQFFFIFLHFRQALVTFVDESFDTISNFPAYQKVKQANDSNTRKYGAFNATEADYFAVPSDEQQQPVRFVQVGEFLLHEHRSFFQAHTNSLIHFFKDMSSCGEMTSGNVNTTTFKSINDIWEGFVKARNEKTHAARREMNWLWMVSTNGKRPANEGVLKEMLLQPDEAPGMPLQRHRPPTRGRPDEDTTQRGDFSKRPPLPSSPARQASPVTPARPARGRAGGSGRGGSATPATPARQTRGRGGSATPATPVTPARPTRGSGGSATPVTPVRPTRGGAGSATPVTPARPASGSGGSATPVRPTRGGAGSVTPVTPARPASGSGGSGRGGGSGSATPPFSYVHQKINKEIVGKGWFTGEVISENEDGTQYIVQYSEASGLPDEIMLKDDLSKVLVNNEYIGRKLEKNFNTDGPGSEVRVYEGTVTDEGDDIDGKHAVYVDYGDNDTEVMSVDALIPLLVVHNPTFEHQKEAESTEAKKKDDDMRFKLCKESESVPDDLLRAVSVLSSSLLSYDEGKYHEHLIKKGRDPLDDLLLRFQQRGWDNDTFHLHKLVAYGLYKKSESMYFELLCADFGYYYQSVLRPGVDKTCLVSFASFQGDAADTILKRARDLTKMVAIGAAAEVIGFRETIGRFRVYLKVWKLVEDSWTASIDQISQFTTIELISDNADAHVFSADVIAHCRDPVQRYVFNQNMLVYRYLKNKDKDIPALNVKENNVAYIAAWLYHGLLYSIRSKMETDVSNAVKIYNEVITSHPADLQPAKVAIMKVIEEAILAGFETNRLHRMTTVVDDADVAEPDTYASDQPDGFPILSALCYHWSNLRTSLIREGGKDPILYNAYFSHIFDEGATQFSGCGVRRGETAVRQIKMALREKLKLDEHMDADDDFGALIDSSLIVRGQSSSLYSYLGTRTHFRAASLLTGGANATEADDAGEKDYVFKKEILFGPHVTFRTESQHLARKAIRFNHEDDDLIVNERMYDYLHAELSAGLIENTCQKYTKVIEKDKAENNWRMRCSIAACMRKRTGGEWEVSEFEYVGAEIPVFNPHMLIKVPHNGEDTTFPTKQDFKYKFFSTQADFVGIAHAARSDLLVGQHIKRTLVVMGEFKTLMEKNNAVERVTHMTSFYQVLANAFLFELMTGLSVDVVVLHFFQRRKRKIGPAGERHFCNMHASLYIKDYVNERSDFGDALRRIRSMVTTNIHLKKPSTDSLDFIYMDKNHFISRIQNQKTEKVNSLFAEKDMSFWFAYPFATMNITPVKPLAESDKISFALERKVQTNNTLKMTHHDGVKCRRSPTPRTRTWHHRHRSSR